MQHFVRITLLGVCVSIGAAVAICLAITSADSSGSTATAASSLPNGGFAPSVRLAAMFAPKTLATTGAGAVRDELMQPASAAYHPAIASQVDKLDSTLARFEQLSREQDQKRKSEQAERLEQTVARMERVAQLNQQLQIEDRVNETLKQLQSAQQGNKQVLEDAISVFKSLPGGEQMLKNAGLPELQGPGPSAGNLPAPSEPSESESASSGAPGASAPPAAAAPPVEILPPAGPPRKVEIDEGDNSLTLNARDDDLRQILDLLAQQGGYNILASGSVQGRVSASLTNVDVDTALDAILRSTGFVARREGNFIYVGTPADFQAMDQRLDKIGTRVYRPNFVTAIELQTLITPMLTRDVGTISISTAAKSGIPSDPTAAGGNDFAGAETLLVRDYEAVLAQIDQVVDEVDCQPLQVSIEATILNVKLDDSNTLGVDFEALRDKNNIRLVSGNPLTDLASVDQIAEGGLKVAFLDSSLSIFLEALETIGDASVVARPRLMCLNKQRAEIHIGEEKGYVSTTVTENAATQSVEFLEVGTQLRIRPYISSDGLIRMEVHPELSTGEVELKGGFTVPDKNVTQVTSNVMVRDGQTVIIGGLIREDLSKSGSQIPLLGSLPVIGAAFRQQTEQIGRTETIILIQPHIVREPQAYCEGNQADCEFNQRQTLYADKMTCLSKRYHGRRYRRLALAALNEGDMKTAVRYANLAIHYDPYDREAINIRSRAIAGGPIGDENVDIHLRHGLRYFDHPVHGHKLSPWILDELGAPLDGPVDHVHEATGGFEVSPSPVEGAPPAHFGHPLPEPPLPGPLVSGAGTPGHRVDILKPQRPTAAR